MPGFPAGRADAVRARIAELLQSPDLWLNRGKPQTGDIPLTVQNREAGATMAGQRIDVRPFLRDLRLTATDQPGVLAVEIDLWLTPAGTARPVEVLGLLGLTDLLEAGAVVERTRLELHEE